MHLKFNTYNFCSCINSKMLLQLILYNHFPQIVKLRSTLMQLGAKVCICYLGPSGLFSINSSKKTLH
jgi:hypothetical protein